MSNITHVRSYSRRKPGPTPEFVAKTKALVGHVLSEREWNSFVGNVLAMELDHVLLSEPLDDPQFDDMDEETKRRVREAGF